MSELTGPDPRESVHPDPAIQAARDVAVFVRANRRLIEQAEAARRWRVGEQMELFTEAEAA